MSGYIADLLDEIPTQSAEDLPVETGVLNLFAVTLREGLAKLNEALLDKFREVDDEMVQIKGMVIEGMEGSVAEKVQKIEDGQQEFAKHHAELSTKVMDLGINVADKVRALEKKIEESGGGPSHSDGAPSKRDLGNVKDLHEWNGTSPFSQWKWVFTAGLMVCAPELVRS